MFYQGLQRPTWFRGGKFWKLFMGGWDWIEFVISKKWIYWQVWFWQNCWYLHGGTSSCENLQFGQKEHSSLYLQGWIFSCLNLHWSPRSQWPLSQYLHCCVFSNFPCLTLICFSICVLVLALKSHNVQDVVEFISEWLSMLSCLMITWSCNWVFVFAVKSHNVHLISCSYSCLLCCVLKCLLNNPNVLKSILHRSHLIPCPVLWPFKSDSFLALKPQKSHLNWISFRASSIGADLLNLFCLWIRLNATNSSSSSVKSEVPLVYY